MSREWKPGTVAMIGAPDGEVLAFRQERQWATLHHLYFSDWQIATVRPLVVIDPEDREEVERLGEIRDAMYERLHPDEYAVTPEIDDDSDTDLLQAALREFASPTLPKPDEPMGWLTVVEEADGTKWVRTGWDGGLDKPWQNEATHAHWQAVPAVRVLSEGVQP